MQSQSCRWYVQRSFAGGGRHGVGDDRVGRVAMLYGFFAVLVYCDGGDIMFDPILLEFYGLGSVPVDCCVGRQWLVVAVLVAFGKLNVNWN